MYGHHRTKDTYDRSNLIGCILCTALANETSSGYGFYTLIGISRRSDRLVIDLFQYRWMACIELLPLNAQPRNAALFCRLYQQINELKPKLLNLGTDEELGTSTGGPQALSRMDSWLKACERHVECSNARCHEYIPTRLLKISRRSFRLVSRTDMTHAHPYICLSYCWGSDIGTSRLELTKETFDEFHAGKRIRSLPKTYRDTMRLARHLNISFVWIDRLCIIQKDMDDWTTESRTMRDVYRSAFLTVAALGAGDDQGGLFHDRNPNDLQPTVVQVRHNIKTPATAYVSSAEYTKPWKHHLRGSPLLSRAWIVQERILSPRVVYFGRKMVYWECWQLAACEVNPQGLIPSCNPSMGIQELDASFTTLRGCLKLKSLLEDSGICDFPSNYDGHLLQWGRIIARYSQCAVTKPTDRLVAIQGLVDEFQTILRNCEQRCRPVRYIAGHWESSIPRSLLWSASDQSSRIDGIAPSWSWASVQHASVNPDSFKATVASDIVFCSLLRVQPPAECQGNDWISCVNIALELRGPLLRLRMSHEFDSAGYWRIKQLDMTNLVDGMSRSLSNDDFYDAIARYDESEPPRAAQCHGLPLVMTKSVSSYKLELVLLVNHKQQFKRVGLAQLWLPVKQNVASWLMKCQSYQITLV